MATKPLQSIKFPGLSDTYTTPQVDNTLTTTGAAADAKKTGDEITSIKEDLSNNSLTPSVKSALLACFEKVAWIDDQGRDYYDALEEALYDRHWQITNTLSHCTSSNASTQVLKDAEYTATITAFAGYTMTGATVSITMGGVDITSSNYSNGVINIPAVTGELVITISAAAKSVGSISAVFTQGQNIVWESDELDSLKQYLTVTATYTDSSTAVIPSEDYSLSGTLTNGTSTITVTYSGATTTFTVNVTGYTWLYRADSGEKLSEQNYVTFASSGEGATETLSDDVLVLYSPYRSVSSGQNNTNFTFTEETSSEAIMRFMIELVSLQTPPNDNLSAANGFRFQLSDGTSGPQLMFILLSSSNNVAVKYYEGNTVKAKDTTLALNDGYHECELHKYASSYEFFIDGIKIIESTSFATSYTLTNKIFNAAAQGNNGANTVVNIKWIGFLEVS